MAIGVVILVIVLAAAGGAAYFVKARGAGERSDAPSQPSTPTPTPTPAAPVLATPAPTPAPATEPVIAPPIDRPASPTPVAAAQPDAPAVEPPDEPDEPDDEPDLSRFGGAKAIKDPRTAALINEPMVPTGRVYDMEDTAPDGDAAEPVPAAQPESTVEVAPPVEPEPVAEVAPEPTPEPEPAVEPEPTPEPVAELTPEPAAEPAAEPEPSAEPVATEPIADEVIELPRDDLAAAEVAPPRDAVDHVLQALIGRAQERQVALTQVAAELVEQANLEDREIDEVLGDLIDLADDDDTIESGERLEELTMFNDAVPKRPGQLTDFARLDAREKKRVIIRVLCLLVALQEDYKLQPTEPASEAETRSWPLARAVWPVKPKADDDDERNLPGRRKKGKLLAQ